MTMKLADRPCVPCQGGVPPLKGEEIQTLLSELGGGWEVIGNHHLEKASSF